MGRTVRCFPAAGIPGSGACAAARRVPVLLAALPQRCSGLHGSFLAEVELGSSRARSWGREPGLKEPRVTGVGPELPWPGKRRPKSRDAVALSAVGRTMGNEGKRRKTKPEVEEACRARFRQMRFPALCTTPCQAPLSTTRAHCRQLLIRDRQQPVPAPN